MRYRSLLTILLTLALATTAAAATGGGTVTTTLKPNKVSKASTLTVDAKGPFSAQGLPKSAMLLVQKGFRSSPKSVRVLCTAKQANGNSCPAGSKIGTGSATATATFAGQTFHPNIALTLYLGKRQQAGDIASVVIIGTLQNSPISGTAHATGRLFKQSGGGLEILFDKLPSFNVPPGATVTVNSLTLKAGAKRTVKQGKGRHKHKVRYSLITNPPTCSGRWTGTFTVTFSSGKLNTPLSTPCRK